MQTRFNGAQMAGFMAHKVALSPLKSEVMNFSKASGATTPSPKSLNSSPKVGVILGASISTKMARSSRAPTTVMSQCFIKFRAPIMSKDFPSMAHCTTRIPMVTLNICLSKTSRVGMSPMAVSFTRQTFIHLNIVIDILQATFFPTHFTTTKLKPEVLPLLGNLGATSSSRTTLGSGPSIVFKARKALFMLQIGTISALPILTPLTTGIVPMAESTRSFPKALKKSLSSIFLKTLAQSLSRFFHIKISGTAERLEDFLLKGKTPQPLNH